MPDPATAAFETAVQVHLANCGLSVPAIRCADGPSSAIDRSSVMAISIRSTCSWTAIDGL
jgi:hypothetical protein